MMAFFLLWSLCLRQRRNEGKAKAIGRELFQPDPKLME